MLAAVAITPARIVLITPSAASAMPPQPTTAVIAGHQTRRAKFSRRLLEYLGAVDRFEDKAT